MGKKAVGLGIALLIVLGCDEGQESTETPPLSEPIPTESPVLSQPVSAEARPSPQPISAAAFLAGIERCSVDDGSRLEVDGDEYLVLDGRCDKDPGAPVGIYPTAEQSVYSDGSHASFGRAYTGAVFPISSIACLEMAADGAPIGDDTNEPSPIWVQVGLEENRSEPGLLELDQHSVVGYIPEVWLRGEVNLKPC